MNRVKGIAESNLEGNVVIKLENGRSISILNTKKVLTGDSVLLDVKFAYKAMRKDYLSPSDEELIIEKRALQAYDDDDDHYGRKDSPKKKFEPKTPKQGLNDIVDSEKAIITSIAGVTYENRQEICSHLYEDAKLSLVREPDNPHDINAIGVFYENHKCGFVPKELACKLSPLIDAGQVFKAFVTNVKTGEGLNTGINIKIVNSPCDGKDEKKDDIPIKSAKNSSEALKLTNEQKEIIDYNIVDNSVLKVIAFAGTGKTTTLLEYSKTRPNLRFLYIAFNKSVQIEAEKQFPTNVISRTSHSLAFRSYGAPYANKLISNLKLNIVKQLLSLETYEITQIVVETLNNFLISADYELNKNHLPRKITSDSHSPDFYLVLAGRLWAHMKDADNDRIGMLHDGYLKLYQLSNPKLDYDCILLDEAQDTNPVVSNIVLSQNCAKILVGDPHQQIYAFRGAVDAMDHIKEDKKFYLTYSFRFGNEIAWVANKILNTFKGETNSLKGVATKNTNKQKDYAIIARTNAKLFDMAAGLINTNKLAFLGGIEGYRFDDIFDVYMLYAGKINDIVNPYIKGFQTYSFLKKFAEEVNDLELKSRCRVVEKHEDKIPYYVERIKGATVAKSHADVILTTAHKSKGSQFSTVMVCSDFPDLFKDANLAPIDYDEVNLIYVTITRAKEFIKFESSWDWAHFISFDKKPEASKILNYFKLNIPHQNDENQSIAAHITDEVGGIEVQSPHILPEKQMNIIEHKLDTSSVQVTNANKNIVDCNVVKPTKEKDPIPDIVAKPTANLGNKLAIFGEVCVKNIQLFSEKLAGIVKHIFTSMELGHGVNFINLDSEKTPMSDNGFPIMAMLFPSTMTITIYLQHHWKGCLKIIIEDKENKMALRALVWYNILLSFFHELCHARALTEGLSSGALKSPEDMVWTEEHEVAASRYAQNQLRELAKQVDTEIPAYDPFFEAAYNEFLKAIEERKEAWAVAQRYMVSKGLVCSTETVSGEQVDISSFKEFMRMSCLTDEEREDKSWNTNGTSFIVKKKMMPEKEHNYKINDDIPF